MNNFIIKMFYAACVFNKMRGLKGCEVAGVCFKKYCWYFIDNGQWKMTFDMTRKSLKGNAISSGVAGKPGKVVWYDRWPLLTGSL